MHRFCMVPKVCKDSQLWGPMQLIQALLFQGGSQWAQLCSCLSLCGSLYLIGWIRPRLRETLEADDALR